MIDLETRTVRGAEDHALSEIEVKFLAHLVRAAGRPSSREDLHREVWGYAGVRGRPVDHVVKRLRRKIEADPAVPLHLVAVHGLGYRLDLPTTEEPASWPVSPFVGRATEVDQVEAALAAGDRLITIGGPPGIGKSRLAVHVASRHAARGGAVTVVPLGDAVSAEDVRQRVRAAPAGLLVADGADRHLSVIEALSTNRGPILATSRIAPTVGRWLEIGPLTPADAVALYLQRARARLADDTALSSQHQAVAALVALLEGIPLAIELEAAGIDEAGPAEQLARLQAVGGTPDGLQRALESSWFGLAPWAREALVQLSVFAASFDRGVAGVVLDVGRPVAEVLRQLRHHSLLSARLETDGVLRLSVLGAVRRFAHERGDPGPAQDRLDRWLVSRVEPYLHAADLRDQRILVRHAADLEHLVMRHRANDPDVAALALAGRFLTADRVGVPDTFEAWRKDLVDRVSRAGLRMWMLRCECATEPWPGSRALRAAYAVAEAEGFVNNQVHLCLLIASRTSDVEASEWLDRAARLAPTEDRAARGHIALRRGSLALGVDLEEARRWYREALELARAAEHGALVDLALGNLGLASYEAGDLASAASYYAAALERAEDAGTAWSVAVDLAGLAAVAAARGHPDEADALARRGLAPLESAPNAVIECTLCLIAGCGRALAGDLDPARVWFTRAMKSPHAGTGSIARVWLALMLAAGGAHTEASDVVAGLVTPDRPPELRDQIAALVGGVDVLAGRADGVAAVRRRLEAGPPRGMSRIVDRVLRSLGI